MQTPHSIPHFIIVQLYLSLCCLTRPGIKMRQPQSSISENCDILWSMGFLRVQYWNKGGFNIVAPDCPTSQHSKQDGWDGLQYIYVYIPPQKKSPAYISLFHVISMSCMGSFCLHISHQRVAPRICPNTVAFAALMEDNSEPWPILWKTVGRSLAKMFQKMQHGATPCLICLSCCNISQGRGLGIGIGLLTTFVDIFLQWSSTCEYQKHIENGLLTSPKIKKALIMISPYQSNQIHQIHGCLWHELLQCFLREPWRPDHTITSEGNPKLDLVKREASFQSFVLLHWELKILEQFWASIHSPNKDTSWKFITQFSREICIKWLFWFIWPLSWS